MFKAVGSTKFTKQEVESVIESFKMASPEKGLYIGMTDLGVCLLALEAYVGRWPRRAGLVAVFVLGAALGVGAPDLNGDGRVGLADLGAAMRQAAGVLAPSGIVNAAESSEGSRK